jgi:hypothetical protein
MTSIVIYVILSFAAGYVVSWKVYKQSRDAKGRFSKAEK